MFWELLCWCLCTDEHAHTKPKSTFENLDLKEKSTMTFLFGPVHVIVSSHMVDCMNKFVACAQNHDYEPYSKPKPGDKISSFVSCSKIFAVLSYASEVFLCLSVCLSVCLTRGLWKKRHKMLRTFFYTIWKINSSSFLTRRMVGRGCPLLREILGKLTPQLWKQRFPIDIRSYQLGL